MTKGVFVPDLSVPSVNDHFTCLVRRDFARGPYCFCLCPMEGGISRIVFAPIGPPSFPSNYMLVFTHVFVSFS